MQELPPHQVVVGLQRQEEGGHTDGESGEQRQLDGDEGVGEVREECDDGQEEGEDVLHEVEGRGPLDVVDDPAALRHHLRQGGEIAVQQHQLGHLASALRAGGHGDAAVGVLQGQNVVDAVAGHGHGVARALQGPDDLALLVGHHPAKDGVAPDGPGDVLVGLQLPGVHPVLRPLDARLLGHGGDGDGVVAGDDLHGNALGAEVVKGLGGAGADGVFQHQEGQGDDNAQELPLLRPVALGQQQHPAALGGEVVELVLQGLHVVP